MKIGGKNREFKYGVNAIRAFVRAAGKTPDEIFGGGFDPRDMEFGCTLVWAGLLWQDRNLTIDQVGNWLDEEEHLYVDAVKDALASFLDGFKRCFGSAETGEDASGEPEEKN
jgi:hypothetical protein